MYHYEDVSIYNYFADQTRLFREEFLTLLSTIDIYFIADTKKSSYLYYKNCAVQVTKDEVIGKKQRKCKKSDLEKNDSYNMADTSYSRN